MRTTTLPRAATAGLALTAILLTGCSGGDGDGDESQADTAAPAGAVAEAQPEEARNDLLANDGVMFDSDGANLSAGRTTPESATTTAELEIQQSAYLIRTGRLEIVDADLAETRDGIDALLARYGGMLADEKTVNDDEGRPIRSKLVLRVPTRNFDTVMAALRENPSVTASDTASEDVATEVLDVESRLTNLRASLSRLRAFLSEADSLRALLDFERRITQVESEIASLVSQREYLADQTSLSTIAIEMHTPDAKPEPKPEKDSLEDAGFLSGLKGGWNALVDVAVVAATGLGAALPFAGLALLLSPVWLVLRRRRRVVPAA